MAVPELPRLLGRIHPVGCRERAHVRRVRSAGLRRAAGVESVQPLRARHGPGNEPRSRRASDRRRRGSDRGSTGLRRRAARERGNQLRCRPRRLVVPRCAARRRRRARALLGVDTDRGR